MSAGTVVKQASTELAELLDKAIASQPVHIVAKSMEQMLVTNISRLRDTLPTLLKGEAERFVRRAIIYYQTAEPKTGLHQATPQSFVMCILEAAEIGLPLDGKLCYAIVYNNKKQDANGKDIWVKEAQCMPDYKGLVAVAKRSGTIKDTYAEVVCENDDFQFERTEGKDTLRHSYKLSGKRGSVAGCYAKVQLPSSEWRFDIMTREDIDQIRGKSKAATSGPWKDVESSDWKEMAKKTAIKRILKGFMDDPGLARALELDDRATGYLPETAEVPDGRSKIDRLTDKLLPPGDAGDRRETTPTNERPIVHPELTESATSEPENVQRSERPKPTKDELLTQLESANSSEDVVDIVFLRSHLSEADATAVEAAGRARKDFLRQRKSGG